MKKIGTFLLILVVVAGIGYFFFGKLEENVVYFVTPSELLQKGKAGMDQPVRLGGMVKVGTVDWKPEIPHLQFQLTDGKKEITILSDKTPPQMFQEKMGVVVEGKLGKSGVFQADRLMVKHSNEYHPPKEGEKPELIFKGLIENPDAS